MSILNDLTNRISKINNLTTTSIQSTDNNHRIVLLGIGNESRGDDGLGPYVINNINITRDNFMLLNCGEVPESFTGKIIKFIPSHIILIDVAKMGLAVGAMRIVECSEIKGLGISTHQLPLNMFTDYLEKETGADIFLIGVEPKTTGFSMNISEKVKFSADLLIKDLTNLLIQF
ncbi:MAG: hydrogenase maturation peptidase HycI [Methanosarcinaceae archaeon]|nr:hydrogenase maturation peptidase HycI [Methanosarcinaceae archaeon]NKQ38765.1 hydrogenase maturation peptidase HycI [Methanosarcinales archaeon]